MFYRINEKVRLLGLEVRTIVIREEEGEMLKIHGIANTV
jgi:hypothetical protein